MLHHRPFCKVLSILPYSCQRFSRRYASEKSCNSFQESSSSITESISDTPLVDAVDRMMGEKGWIHTTYVLGDLACAGIDNLSRIAQSSASLLLRIQENVGCEASVVLLIFGMLVRICALVFSFYGDRAISRMVCALPELSGVKESYQRIKATGSAMEQYSMVIKLRKKEKMILEKHQTSTIKCFSSIAATPVVGYGFATSSIFSSLHSTPSFIFVWCTSLSQVDPTLVLPFSCCMLSLLNFELLLSPNLRKYRWIKAIRWAARLCAVLLTPVVGTVACGVCVFWIGMSIIGISQPFLLRNKRFRRRFDFPPLAPSTSIHS